MRILIISASREIIHVMVPPLGEAYIAAYLLEQGHDVQLLDLVFSENVKGDIEKIINNFNPQIIGISIRNIDSTTYPGNLFFYLPVKNIINLVNLIAGPDIPIILGGSGFSIFPEEILRDLNHSIGVFGEGEYVFGEIVKQVEKGEDIRKIERGICFVDEKGIYHQKPPWRVENLDDLPFPARQLLDNNEYSFDYMNSKGRMWGNIQTKRGCTKNCIYCSYKLIEGPHVRYRSPAKIAEELDIIVNNYGIENIFIVDSLFNLNHDHVKEICEAIIKRKVDVKWGCNYAPDGNFLDLMPLMKESGAAHFATGMESLSNEMLGNIKKDRTADEAIMTSRKCVELEIEQLMHIMVGGPGETLQTVHSSLDQLEKLSNYMGGIWQGDGDVMIFTGMRIYPDTQLQKIAIKEGIIEKNTNLLTPKFYISPKIVEVELWQLMRKYCERNPRWMVPGLGLNNPEGFAELSQIQFSRYKV